jgi:hypothetical protein
MDKQQLYNKIWTVSLILLCTDVLFLAMWKVLNLNLPDMVIRGAGFFMMGLLAVFAFATVKKVPAEEMERGREIERAKREEMSDEQE